MFLFISLFVQIQVINNDLVFIYYTLSVITIKRHTHTHTYIAESEPLPNFRCKAGRNLHLSPNIYIAQSDQTVEYTDCFSAEE